MTEVGCRSKNSSRASSLWFPSMTTRRFPPVDRASSMVLITIGPAKVSPPSRTFRYADTLLFRIGRLDFHCFIVSSLALVNLSLNSSYGSSTFIFTSVPIFLPPVLRPTWTCRLLSSILDSHLCSTELHFGWWSQNEPRHDGSLD